MNLHRIQSSAGTCTLDSIKCQHLDNYWNAFSDFIDISFNWDLSFTSHMGHWAQWIKFGNKTVFIIFISCCSLLKGRKKIQLSYFMAAVFLVDLSSINHLLRCCEVLTMHQQGIPGFHLNFSPIQEHFLQCPVISFRITHFPHASFLLSLHPRFTFTDKTCRIYKKK